MSLRWKEIEALMEEARPLLVGSSLQKISQVREIAAGESFVLQGFGAAGPWRLWNCLQQDHTTWVLADDDWDLDAQPEPSTFVMVLRKHLQGKRIDRMEQVAGERFLLLHFENGNSLLFELLPKRANLVLLDSWSDADRTGKCIQSFRRISLEPGAIYRLRPPPEGAVKSDVRPFVAEAMERGKSGDALEESAKAHEESGKAGGKSAEHSNADDEKDHGFSPAGFPVHRAIAKHYWEAQQKGGFGSYQRLWRQAWKTHSKRIQTALENAKSDFDQAKEAELFQQRGMALVGELYQLGPKNFPKEKMLKIGDLEIPLDPSKTYAENSEQLFRKAKKLHRAVGELQGRVEELEKKAARYAEVGKKIEAAKEDSDLEKNASFFQDEGIPIPEKPTGVEEKKASEAKPFLEIQSSDGFTILCGRNQEENRQVTFRESRGSDVWLHVKGIPGAHVVVKAQKNKTVPLNTLLEAAQVCLYYSKIRKGKRAEVDYTPRKNVKAIKGTLAEVTYTGNKALYLEADPESLKKILRKG